jgi:hypothetical protein
MKINNTINGMRLCSNCFQMKDVKDFYVKRPNGHQSRCKVCNAEVVAGYHDRAKHGEVKRYNTKYRRAL